MTYIAANNNKLYLEYDKIYLNSSNNLSNFLKNDKIFIVDINFGKLYCKQIKNEFPNICQDIYNGKYTKEINMFSQMGEDHMFFSNELNINLNSNTTRYIYQAILISNYIKSKYDNKYIDIVEIGGGYGGLCYWINIFLKSINNYYIIDLDGFCNLQTECLSKLNTPFTSISCKNVNLIKKTVNPLFIISNYAYSEFDEFYQNYYRDTIINLADSGFMIWNNNTGIYKFTELPIIIEEERPSFSEYNCYNKFIYF